MILLSHPRRAVRPRDWSNAKAVAFIVTLAAARSVTLAARAAGMNRKAAYALRDRDAVFAGAWRQALAATATRRKGDKVEEVEDPPVSLSQGDTVGNAAPRDRTTDERRRAAHFDRLLRSPRLDPDLLLLTKPLSRCRA